VRRRGFGLLVGYRVVVGLAVLGAVGAGWR